jgi:hypothetical protein
LSEASNGTTGNKDAFIIFVQVLTREGRRQEKSFLNRTIYGSLTWVST